MKKEDVIKWLRECSDEGSGEALMKSQQTKGIAFGISKNGRMAGRTVEAPKLPPIPALSANPNTQPPISTQFRVLRNGGKTEPPG